MKKINSNKVGVFSGGGALGAYQVGVLSKLKPKYNIVYGCSTGALIAIFAILEKWDVLTKLYTSITAKDIFSVNPFYKNGMPNLFVIIPRLILGKSVGDTENLRELIKKHFTIEMYNEIISLNKDVCIVVTSVTDKENQTKYVYLSKTSYEDFCFYVWASTCVPIVCTLAIDANGDEYCDGGVTEVTPIQQAVIDNAKEIDLFNYNNILENKFRSKTKNSFHLLARVWNIFRNKLENNSYTIALMKDVKVNEYNPPYKLADNPMIFDNTKMLEWYNLGYNSIK